MVEALWLGREPEDKPWRRNRPLGEPRGIQMQVAPGSLPQKVVWTQVDEAFRGQGLGGVLIEAAEEICGCNVIWGFDFAKCS